MAAVVVAEDDDDIRMITVRLLRRAGHTVEEAPDGQAALELVRQVQPDVVVSDIDMPRMSGVQLCQAIRADPTTADLPVIFVSGSLLPGDARPAAAQATAILRKPFKPAELLACLDKALTSGHEPGQEPSQCP
ncbi:response regulator [Actinoplanes sp. NPDC000266]